MCKMSKQCGAKQLLVPGPEVAIRLRDVEFIVEATAFERDTLYLQYRDLVDWRDGMPKRMVVLGTAYGQEVRVLVSVSFVYGKGILFVEPASELFDHHLLAQWLDTYCNPLYENGTRKARTDARSFRDCLRALREDNAAGPLPIV